MDHRTETHGAGLQGDVQGRIRQAIILPRRGRRLQSQDFGVSGWVTRRDGAITTPTYNLAVCHQYSADGNFTNSLRFFGKG